MRVTFTVILLLHAAIHLLGFLKAFQIAEIEQLNLSISSTAGIAWLLACLFLTAAAGLYLANIPWWWMVGTAGITLSQVLIVLYWQDAKFGTIANIIVLVGCLVGYGYWSFDRMVSREISNFWSGAAITDSPPVEQEVADSLPEVVQQWMNRSGALEHERVHSVHFTQSGRMKTSPGGNWMPVRAEQFVRTGKPGFIWIADVRAAPYIHLSGRDKYLDGRGHMLIKLLSLIPVADSRGKKIDQGTLLRFLAEIVWYPPAALRDYIEWEQLDSLTAKATMTIGGITASGIFEFNERGDPVRFEAERYYSRKDDGPTLETWVISIDENSYQTFDDLRVPTRAEVTWKLEEGDFTWFQLEVGDFIFNQKVRYENFLEC